MSHVEPTTKKIMQSNTTFHIFECVCTIFADIKLSTFPLNKV